MRPGGGAIISSFVIRRLPHPLRGAFTSRLPKIHFRNLWESCDSLENCLFWVLAVDPLNGLTSNPTVVSTPASRQSPVDRWQDIVYTDIVNT